MNRAMKKTIYIHADDCNSQQSKTSNTDIVGELNLAYLIQLEADKNTI